MHRTEPYIFSKHTRTERLCAESPLAHMTFKQTERGGREERERKGGGGVGRERGRERERERESMSNDGVASERSHCMVGSDNILFML